MVTWVTSAGGVADKLEIITYGAENRGVVSKEDIATGETILFVPDSHLITLEIAREAPIG
jgi:histone-lysine N-methyltransferase SETD3